MVKRNPRIPYNGGLPAADETVVLFDTTMRAGHLRRDEYRWFVYTFVHDERGRVKAYFKRQKTDGSFSDWKEYYNVQHNSPGQGDTVSAGEIFVEQYDHVKVEWDNGNMPQTVFEPQMALSDDRAPCTTDI